jgi:hypothetical protein
MCGAARATAWADRVTRQSCTVVELPTAIRHPREGRERAERTSRAAHRLICAENSRKVRYGPHSSTGVWLLQNLFVEDVTMFRELLSRRNLLLSSLGLLILTGMTVVLASKGVLATTPRGNEDDERKEVFYTASFSSGTGAELEAIEVSGSKITITDIGPTHGGGCASLAMSPSGTLFSMCGNLFGTQQLATIDTKTGLATCLAKASLARSHGHDVRSRRDSVRSWGL